MNTDFYKLHAEINREFFGGVLREPLIICEDLNSDDRYGDCCLWNIDRKNATVVDNRQVIRINRYLITDDLLFARYSLAHEAVHEFLNQIGMRRHGHGGAFSRQCNRISPLLGLVVSSGGKGRIRGGSDRNNQFKDVSL